MNEGEAFIRAEATKRGIDSDKAVTVAESEGGTMPPGNVGKFDTGWSFWPFQLHYGSQGYERFGTVAGMGNSFTAATGWQPGDPAAWRDSVRYALDAAKRNGWGAWYGAKARGITGYSGIDRSFYWPGTPDDEWDYRKPPTEPLRAGLLPTQSGAQSARNPAQYNPDAPVDPKAGGWKPWYGAAAVGVGEWDGIDREHPWNPDAERWDFEQVAPRVAARTFDPNTPDEKQRQDWTCAIRSTMWLLKSLGIDVTPEEAQDAMHPRYVTPELGLLDATGSGIVAVLRARWGVAAENHGSVTFDQVAALAGKQPVAIGGRNWGGPGKGHWSAVRGFDGTRLLLANPASGTVYGDASLTREQWAWRGPWSAVVVPLAEQPAQPVDELDALRQQVVSLTAQLEDKARRLDTEVSKVGYMTGDLADALQAVVNTLRSLRPPAA